MISHSGRRINGKWIPTNPLKIHPPTPPCPPKKAVRKLHASKTRRPGLNEAIRVAFKDGKETIEKIREAIFTQGFDLSKSSVNSIMRELKIGKRNKKRAKKGTAKGGTCNQKIAWEDES